MQTNRGLIDAMIVSGVLRTPRIIKAFKNRDRRYFVPEALHERLYVDAPLPIGQSQTISQPSTVAFMLELLGAKEGDDVLDIGSGSGWTAALLCEIVGEDGTVTGLERHDGLVKLAQKDLARFGDENCHIEKATDTLGIVSETFDTILVSASAEEIPRELFLQMRAGARLVIPIRNSIFRFTKMSENEIKKEEYPGFVFVPLIYQRPPRR